MEKRPIESSSESEPGKRPAAKKGSGVPQRAGLYRIPSQQEMREMSSADSQRIDAQLEESAKQANLLKSQIDKDIYLDQEFSKVCAQHQISGADDVKVQVEGTKLIRFRGKVQCLSAFALNGASVIAIVSKKGAILAKAAPVREYDDRKIIEPPYLDVELWLKFGALNLYMQHEDELFDKDVFGVIILGTRKGEIMLKTQAEMIKDQLVGFKFTNGVVMHMYEVHYPNEPSGPGSSNFFIDLRQPTPTCYLDNRKITCPDVKNPPAPQNPVRFDAPQDYKPPVCYFPPSTKAHGTKVYDTTPKVEKYETIPADRIIDLGPVPTTRELIQRSPHRNIPREEWEYSSSVATSDFNADYESSHNSSPAGQSSSKQPSAKAPSGKEPSDKQPSAAQSASKASSGRKSSSKR